MPSADPLRFIDDGLARTDAAGLRRRLRELSTGPGPVVERDGRRLLHLCANNYLGLAQHPTVLVAAREALELHGAGAGASRLISGHLTLHARLEAAIARLKKQEAALVFPSGYAANLGAITALAGPRDRILADGLNHASLNDGCRLSRATVRHYRHADVGHLEQLLALGEPHDDQRTLIVTDGVFSMDGDVAPLRELADIAETHGALLVVDDAHGTGVLGETGAGTAEALGVADRVHVHLGTLSKALGGQGGFVAGPQKLIDWLVNTARPYIYTTALAPPLAAAGLAAVELLASEPERRDWLRENAAFLREHLTAAGFRLPPVGDPLTPIIPVIVGDVAATVAMSEALEQAGLLVPAVRPPTVPKDSSRLRVTVMSEHTRADLERAVEVFIATGRNAGLI